MAKIDSRTSPAFHYLPFLSYYEAPPGGNYGTQFAHWGGGHQVYRGFKGVSLIGDSVTAIGIRVRRRGLRIELHTPVRR